MVGAAGFPCCLFTDVKSIRAGPHGFCLSGPPMRLAPQTKTSLRPSNPDAGKAVCLLRPHNSVQNKKSAKKRISYFKWSGRRDLNPRPHGPEPCALPSALRPVNNFKTSGRRESNPRSLAPQASALPLSHSPYMCRFSAATPILYHSLIKSASASLISVSSLTSVCGADLASREVAY